jgi:hypothetical protein
LLQNINSITYKNIINSIIVQNGKILLLLFFNLLIFTNLQNYNLQTIHRSNKISFVYCLLYSLVIKIKEMYIFKNPYRRGQQKLANQPLDVMIEIFYTHG